jgi:beta-glucosidase
MHYDKSLIASPEHIALAREVAEKSAVLLKNENTLLPFDKNKMKKIVVIGTLADSRNTGDHGSSWVRAKYVVSPLQGIKNYFKGQPVEIVTALPTELVRIKHLCENADAVIIIAGLGFRDEGEFISMEPQKIRDPKKPEKNVAFALGIIDRAGDRSSLNLKKTDIDIIKAAASVSSKVTVCLVSGGPIMVEDWYDRVPSILQTFYNGMEGGNALARILFGDVNPSGKLPFTVPKNQEDLPPFNSYVNQADYGYYHGYTLFDKKNLPVRFPFGYGLSYTSFRCSGLRVLTPIVTPGEKLKLSVEIENTGDRPGAEVEQLYIGFTHSKVDRPVKLLRGFKKIDLLPNEKKEITFEVNPEDLAFYNPQLKRWEVENMEHEIYIGNSSASSNLQTASVKVTGF